MANTFTYSDKQFGIGDTVSVTYKIKEGDKFRHQAFAGIVVKIRGQRLQERMITLRKISRSGIGVERILPLSSPFIADIKLDKKSTLRKARAYFVRDLSQKQLRHKLYKSA